MEFLNVPPGPLIGEVMEMLYERRIEDGPYTEEEAYELVKKWWDTREKTKTPDARRQTPDVRNPQNPHRDAHRTTMGLHSHMRIMGDHEHSHRSFRGVGICRRRVGQARRRSQRL